MFQNVSEKKFPSKRLPLQALLVCGALLLAGPAPAQQPVTTPPRGVYFNNVEVSNLRSQKFTGVDVEFDAQGNVRITSQAYQVGEVKPAAPAAEPAPPSPLKTASAHVWLVSEENVTGDTQYAVDVFLNGKFVRTIKSGEPQVVEDVSAHVVAGENKVILRAVKDLTGGRRSQDREHYLRVYMGTGTASEDGSITIEDPQVDFQLTAADLENTAKQMTLLVR